MANTERALRRMIAELAEMPAHACRTVLNQLDEAQSDRVRELLAEYRGQGEPVAGADLEAQDLPQDLSPWLAELLGASATDANALQDDRPLTRSTKDALRACAAELGSNSGRSAEPQPSFWQVVAKRLPFPGRKAGMR